MTLDIKNFYLNTPMEQYKYVRIKLDDVPEEIIQQYLLQDKVDSEGYIFIKVRKGMYGLPQDGHFSAKFVRETPEQARIFSKQSSTWALDS